MRRPGSSISIPKVFSGVEVKTLYDTRVPPIQIGQTMSLWRCSVGLKSGLCAGPLGFLHTKFIEPSLYGDGWEDLTHSSSSQRCSVRLRSGLRAGHSSSFTPNWSNHDKILACSLEFVPVHEVRYCHCMRRPGSLSTFQFIPKVFSWVEVRTLKDPWVARDQTVQTVSF